jgi:DNA polymerase III gamma/tau subunit
MNLEEAQQRIKQLESDLLAAQTKAERYGLANSIMTGRLEMMHRVYQSHETNMKDSVVKLVSDKFDGLWKDNDKLAKQAMELSDRAVKKELQKLITLQITEDQYNRLLSEVQSKDDTKFFKLISEMASGYEEGIYSGCINSDEDLYANIEIVDGEVK